MSSDIEYLLQLHRNGVIIDGDLRIGIRALKEPNVEEPLKGQEENIDSAGKST